MKKTIGILVLLVCCVMVLAGCGCRHKWEPATCTSARTCSECGESEGEPLGHIWLDATCTETKLCSVCGLAQGSKLGHDWKSATCTDPRSCTRCGTTEGKSLGHKWQEATCEEPGACTNCGEKNSEPLGHDWQQIPGTWTDECTRCEQTQDTESDTLVYDELYGAWAADKYHFPDGNSVSYREFNPVVKKCISLDFCIWAEGNYGASMEGNWDVYLKIDGEWEKTTILNYTASNDSVTITFDTPTNVEAIMARTTHRGTFSWSFNIWTENVICVR